jgi:hypothetical protein
MCIAALALAFSTHVTHADPVLDQSYEGPFCCWASSGILYRAQTFTVDASGLLTEFEVYMSSAGEGSSHFQIWRAPGGTPEDDPRNPACLGHGEVW